MAMYSDMFWKYRVAVVSPDPRRNDLEQLRLELREEGQDEYVVLDGRRRLQRRRVVPLNSRSTLEG